MQADDILAFRQFSKRSGMDGFDDVSTVISESNVPVLTCVEVRTRRVESHWR